MEKYHVLGVMSGTSLDGIDIADIQFSYDNTWNFELGQCETIPYSKKWEQILSNAYLKTKEELHILNGEYTDYLANCINTFIKKNKIVQLDAVCSHGHTILHEPENNYTLQIGNLPKIADLIKQNVVCDFRVQDVQLGGQGAPLVPIGDNLLFANYDFCLNLGGFANISFQHHNQRVAFDNCPVNTVLNHFAKQLGKPFDYNGNFARKGNLNNALLNELNACDYYKKEPPKSLGIEWVEHKIIPLINKYAIATEDILHTFSIHIATVIANDINANNKTNSSRILISGGGAYNSFIIEALKQRTKIKIEVAQPKVLEFKEALIFGLLGILKLNNQINVLSSVTGSVKDHSSGNVFYYENDII